MSKLRIPAMVALGVLLVGGAREETTPKTYPDANRRARQILHERLPAPYEALKPLHQPLAMPAVGDWLAEHRESGQSFREYCGAKPVRPTERRRFIRIQPIGTFSPKQWEIIKLTADYMERFFGVTTNMLPKRGTGSIPDTARRQRFGGEQLLTSYLRERVLKPSRRGDVLACVGFTSNDLWPGRGWNFVYGEASLRDRVGVWSIARNGNPDTSPEEFALCLRRTLKTGVHETAHILTMRHCVAYECVMNGSNHRRESDRAPLFLCPNCLAKLCWNTSQEPAARYRRLLAFYKEHKLEAEEQRCEALLAKLEQDVPHSR
jgi:archaemetzincin